MGISGKDRLKKMRSEAATAGDIAAPTAVPHIFRALSDRSERTDVQELELTAIQVDPDQPRKYIDEVKLRELAASIKEKGVLQPILVKRVGEGQFRIVYGERRYRACQLLGQTTIKAIIKDSCEDSQEIALIENIQRENLNPIEECMGIKKLMEKKGYTQEEVAIILGKDQPSISRALKIAEFVIASPDAAEITTGSRVGMEHLLIAAGQKSVDEGTALLKQIVSNKMSVARAREASKKQNPSTVLLDEKNVIKKLHSLRKNVDLSFMETVSVTNTSKYQHELETTMAHLETAKTRIQEEITRITTPGIG